MTLVQIAALLVSSATGVVGGMALVLAYLSITSRGTGLSCLLPPRARLPMSKGERRHQRTQVRASIALGLAVAVSTVTALLPVFSPLRPVWSIVLASYVIGITLGYAFFCLGRYGPSLRFLADIVDH